MNWESKERALDGFSNQFGINISNLQYMIKLIDRYGMENRKKKDIPIITGLLVNNKITKYIL